MHAFFFFVRIGKGGAQGELATLGDLKGLERDGKAFEMVDGNPFNADKAYKDSKVSQQVHTMRIDCLLLL